MPGQIIHTNEICVLLGDNIFVDRSARQALDIVDRRVQGWHDIVFCSIAVILNEAQCVIRK